MTPSTQKSSNRRSLNAMIICMGINTLVYSLSYPLLSLVMDHRGINAEMIGISTAIQASSIFFFAPVAPKLISRFGPIPVMVFSLFAMIGVFLLFPLIQTLWLFVMLRFFLGVTNNLMWIAGESVVNQLTDEANRGKSIARYAMALSGGFAAGPFILTLTGTEGWLPFFVGAAIVGVSMLPLFVVENIKSQFKDKSTIRFREVLTRSPIPMLTNLAFAASSGIFITFIPIYGLRLGIVESTALIFITVAAIGGTLIQPIIGNFADRMNRTLLLLIILVLTVFVTILMPYFVAIPIASMVYFFLYGGIRTGMYGLSVTLMGEKFRGAELASASALFNLMWGIGNAIGPYAGGYAINIWNPHGVPYSIAVIVVLVMPVALIGYFKSR